MEEGCGNCHDDDDDDNAADGFDGNEKIIYPHVPTSACATPRNEGGGRLLKTESEAGG